MRGLHSKGYSQQHRSKHFKICLERCATACKVNGNSSTYTLPYEKFVLILKLLIRLKLLPAAWILAPTDPLLQLGILCLLASLTRYTEVRRKISLNSIGTTNSIRPLQSFPSWKSLCGREGRATPTPCLAMPSLILTYSDYFQYYTWVQVLVYKRYCSLHLPSCLYDNLAFPDRTNIRNAKTDGRRDITRGTNMIRG
jgi:hypothetical protein